VEACAYGRPGSGRDGVLAALCLGLEIKDLFGSAGDQALVVRDQEMGSVNFPAEGRAGYRSAPSTHGYPVYAARSKRSVFSRVPTHFRPESPRSRRKTLYFQHGGCAGHAQICLLTANSGLAEFDFRYNNRAALGISDSQRRDRALARIGGKRLTYR
jgi:hypothetical protein